jgi:hypothetical protein
VTTKLSPRTAIAGSARAELRAMNVQFPGVVVTYDASQQLASVQPMCKRRRYGEDGEPIDERLPVIPNVPVNFGLSSKFEMICDIEVGDRVWVECSQDSLDDWLTNGDEAPATELEPFQLTDAVAFPGFRDFGHPRLACPKGVMRFGAVDGPQFKIDLNEMSLEITALNAIRIFGQGEVRIESTGNVIVQGHVVDPISTGDLG